MSNRVVERVRRVVERLLPWFDRAERDQRAARTQRIRKHAIRARVTGEIAVADPFRQELDGAVLAFQRKRP